MPVAPRADSTNEDRKVFLQTWFPDLNTLRQVKNAWGDTITHIDMALAGVAIVITTINTAISAIQAGLSVKAEVNAVLSYVQLGLNVISLVIGGICAIYRTSFSTPRDAFNTQFNEAFFSSPGYTPVEIWGDATHPRPEDAPVLRPIEERRRHCFVPY